jgi:hypothetical protein
LQALPIYTEFRADALLSRVWPVLCLAGGGCEKAHRSRTCVNGVGFGSASGCSRTSSRTALRSRPLARWRRHGLDAHLVRPGAADDSRPGALLRRHGATQKHPRHHDALHGGSSSATVWPLAKVWGAGLAGRRSISA